MKNIIHGNKVLSPDELSNLQTTLLKFENKNPRDVAMILLALECGLRGQEILNLTPRDITSRKTLAVKTLKKGNPREIPISSRLWEILQAIIPAVATERIFPFSPQHLRRIWGYYRPVKKGFHCLRHTFAVGLYGRSANVRFLQKMLGHRHLTTTEVYMDFDFTEDFARKAMYPNG